MNTISSGSLIRQKATAELFCKLDNQVNLFHPREDSSGNFFVSSHAGEILKFNETGNIEVLLTIGGQPNCVAFDGQDFFYYADIAHAIVYMKRSLSTSTGRDMSSEDLNGELDTICKDYEGTPLKGPTSIALNKEEETLVFCDSGNFGTSSLNRPYGSLFICDLQSRITRPILLNCLAHPSDLVLDITRNCIYVCETFTNRIIRVVNKDGIYNSSIFYQFSGRMGPSAIAIDDTLGNIYVARYEFQNDENEIDGIISVINKEGMLIGELVIPKLSEITGLLIPSKYKDVIYFTEKNSNGIFKIKLSNFINEMDKLEENNKFY